MAQCKTQLNYTMSIRIVVYLGLQRRLVTSFEDLPTSPKKVPLQLPYVPAHMACNASIFSSF